MGTLVTPPLPFWGSPCLERTGHGLRYPCHVGGGGLQTLQSRGQKQKRATIGHIGYFNASALRGAQHLKAGEKIGSGR